MTEQKSLDVTRRSAIGATGLGVIALSSLSRGASAKDHKMSATEKANKKGVAEFMKMWSDPDCTGEKLAAFMSETCVLRMVENKPAVIGRTDSIAAFDAYLKDGQRFGIDVLDTLAIGPLVANSRSDYVIVPGKEPTGRFAVAGVFILRDGKIKEWADYLVPNS